MSAFTPDQLDEIRRLITNGTDRHGTLIRQLQGSTTRRFASVETQENTTLAAYADLPGGTIGPSVTVPATGSYIVSLGYEVVNTAPNDTAMSYQNGATAAVDADGTFQYTDTAGKGYDAGRQMQRTLTAGTVLTAKYKTSGGTASFRKRYLRIEAV